MHIKEIRSSDPLNTAVLKSEITFETNQDWVAGGWMAPTNTRRQRTTTKRFQPDAPAIGSQVEEKATPKTKKNKLNNMTTTAATAAASYHGSSGTTCSSHQKKSNDTKPKTSAAPARKIVTTKSDVKESSARSRLLEYKKGDLVQAQWNGETKG